MRLALAEAAIQTAFRLRPGCRRSASRSHRQISNEVLDTISACDWPLRRKTCRTDPRVFGDGFIARRPRHRKGVEMSWSIGRAPPDEIPSPPANCSELHYSALRRSPARSSSTHCHYPTLRYQGHCDWWNGVEGGHRPLTPIKLESQFGPKNSRWRASREQLLLLR